MYEFLLRWVENIELTLILGKRLTLDIMLELGFGQKHDMMRDADAQFVIDILQNYNWRMGVCFQFPLLAKLHVESIVRSLSLDLKRQERWENWKDGLLSKLLNKNDKDKGRFALFLDAKDLQTQEAISFQKLWAEGSVWMLAGICSHSLMLTTDATLSYCIWQARKTLL